MAKEAAKAVEAATYKHRVVETEARLNAEVTIICRDYCAETYYQTLDRARVPTNFNLRRADKVYYPKDINEDPIALPPPAALPFPLPLLLRLLFWPRDPHIVLFLFLSPCWYFNPLRRVLGGERFLGRRKRRRKSSKILFDIFWIVYLVCSP